jgi:hypothetical protein
MNQYSSRDQNAALSNTLSDTVPTCREGDEKVTDSNKPTILERIQPSMEIFHIYEVPRTYR